ncbi:MAG: DUF169 domain-containing protein [candidate division Zixibacteria bacterium]|nr:DUF169 domain-containing protein [candidate division Zixibacteria bacterium]
MLKDFDLALSKYIRPGSFPLAIRMVKAGEELSERTKRPKRDMDIQVAICQTFSLARRYGWQIAVGEEDVNCPLALTAFGFRTETETFACGEMCAGMFTETKSAGARTEVAVPKFSFQQYRYILAAPIARADFQPNVYLVYGNSAQIMRLMAAVLYMKGGYLTSKFSARLDCADICIETMKTGQAQIILPCYGDRVFGQTQDDEMAIAIPVGIEPDVMVGLEGTHRGGIRYPVPSYLRYTPQYPAHYYKLFDAWKKEEK